eukprot:12843987-Ditylum_brightwellii.AAC.1
MAMPEQNKICAKGVMLWVALLRYCCFANHQGSHDFRFLLFLAAHKTEIISIFTEIFFKRKNLSVLAASQLTAKLLVVLPLKTASAQLCNQCSEAGVQELKCTKVTVLLYWVCEHHNHTAAAPIKAAALLFIALKAL